MAKNRQRNGVMAKKGGNHQSKVAKRRNEAASWRNIVNGERRK